MKPIITQTEHRMSVEEWYQQWNEPELTDHVVDKSLSRDMTTYQITTEWNVEDMERCFGEKDLFEIIDDFIFQRESNCTFWFDIHSPEIKSFFGKYYLNCN